jgi:hypothetical protein
MRTLADLAATLPQVGAVAWIGVRPGRGQTVAVLDAAEARGLIRVGDPVCAVEPA